jgi:hypothetical protein
LDLIGKLVSVTKKNHFNSISQNCSIANEFQFPMFWSPQCQWPKLFNHSFGWWNCSITSLVIVGMLFRGCMNVSVNKWSQHNLFRKLTEYYLTHRTKYLVTWRNILPPIMDEHFFWMKKCMINKMDELSNECWQ